MRDSYLCNGMIMPCNLNGYDDVVDDNQSEGSGWDLILLILELL